MFSGDLYKYALLSVVRILCAEVVAFLAATGRLSGSTHCHRILHLCLAHTPHSPPYPDRSALSREQCGLLDTVFLCAGSLELHTAILKGSRFTRPDADPRDWNR